MSSEIYVWKCPECSKIHSTSEAKCECGYRAHGALIINGSKLSIWLIIFSVLYFCLVLMFMVNIAYSMYATNKNTKRLEMAMEDANKKAEQLNKETQESINAMQKQWMNQFNTQQPSDQYNQDQQYLYQQYQR